jgi:hypothetical protein
MLLLMKAINIKIVILTFWEVAEEQLLFFGTHHQQIHHFYHYRSCKRMDVQSTPPNGVSI